MPIYEYECKNCGTRFEKLQPITADPIKICPNCSQENVRRIIHPSGIIFKGSGWYINDTRKSQPTEGGSESGSASDKAMDTKSSETKSSETKTSETKSTPSDKSGSAKESAS